MLKKRQGKMMWRHAYVLRHVTTVADLNTLLTEHGGFFLANNGIQMLSKLFFQTMKTLYFIIHFKINYPSVKLLLKKKYWDVEIILSKELLLSIFLTHFTIHELLFTTENSLINSISGYLYNKNGERGIKYFYNHVKNSECRNISSLC